MSSPVPPITAGTASAARRAALAMLAGVVVGLAACAPLSPVAHEAAARRPVFAAFELQGRLSATDGQQAASGRVEWQHRAHADSWTVFTPLGQIAAQLDSDATGATLLTADGLRERAASADELLPRVLGVELPVAQLSRWVQASPDGHADVRQRDALGRPALVIDRGWRIDYLDYAGATPDAAPARLDISRGDARLRLIIDSWTALP